MRRSDSIASLLLAVPLTMVGCPGDDTGAEGSSGDSGTPTTTGTTMVASSGDPTGNDSSGSPTTGGPAPSCEDPQPLPDAPVDCTGVEGVLDGSAIIEENGDTIAVLDGIREVTGSVRINRLEVTDLSFMACLDTVGGDLTIFGNDQLTDVSGLWSLTNIGTDFVFSENEGALDFNGLPNLASVPGNVIMRGNDSLTSISGFHTLESLGNLTIQNNDSLLHINGLGGLTTVSGVFAVTANPALCINSVDCVGSGITSPPMPPPSWSTQGNDLGC